MFTSRLFLGVKVCGELELVLNRADKEILNVFISPDSSEYLQEYEHQGFRYIGKFTDPVMKLTQLELLEMNIISLVKRIAPTVPPKTYRVYLLTRIE